MSTAFTAIHGEKFYTVLHANQMEFWGNVFIADGTPIADSRYTADNRIELEADARHLIKELDKEYAVVFNLLHIHAAHALDIVV